jgi:hypothetical protein
MSDVAKSDQAANLSTHGSAQGVDTLSWMLLTSSPSETASIQAALDKIFSEFSFYPEVEWIRFGYPPADGCEVLSAWRHPGPDAVGFIFLTDNPGMRSQRGASQLLLRFSGKTAILKPYVPQILKLKDDLTRKNGRKQNETQLNARLDRANSARLMKGLMALMAPITAVINGLALYLHKVPPPDIQIGWLLRAYQVLLPLVFVSALALLLMFTVICALYVCKYGFLLLRRL